MPASSLELASAVPAYRDSTRLLAFARLRAYHRSARRIVEPSFCLLSASVRSASMENLGPLSLPLSFFGTAVIVLLAIVLYFSGRRHYGPAAFWTALLLAGQACALQLVASGPVIRLQMFQPWGDLLKLPGGIFFAAFLAQAAIVFWGIRRYWPAIRQHRPRLLTWPRLLLLLLLLAYAATTITPEWAQSVVAGNWRDLAIRTASNGSKIALGLLMLFTGLANLALAAATIPAEKWDRCVAWWRSGQRSWLPWVAAAWT
ncbi:MAG: hypothetical protein ACRD6I_08845, partial [Candidatus Acidiferrales bacterium]